MFFSILVITFGYFLGSISSAILICKILHLPNPRNHGSKNPGATNVLRIAGYKIAIGVVIFDILKGSIPIWMGKYFEVSPIYLGATAILTCIGHIYPIFFQFHGGKGVATAFGSITAINLHFTIIMVSIWIPIVLLFKYSSLGTIITALIMPLYTWYFYPQHLLLITTISTLILIKHCNNIKRLWLHQEKKYRSYSNTKK